MARAQTVIAGDDAAPESDRLEGFPHPRETAAIFGHAQAEAMFADALTSGTLHHAWLMAGPAGIGKATLAYRFARAALATDADRDLLGGPLDVSSASATARLVDSQAHPGLLVLRRPWDQKTRKFASTIPIDDVRRVKSFLALTAEAGSRRVVIVDSADDLNVNSANALLKSLEEPPKDSLFLIITAAPGRLLPTIRSRCRLLPIGALDDGALRSAVDATLKAVEKQLPEADVWPDLIRLSGGAVRTALACLDGDGLALQADIDGYIASLPRPDLGRLHSLADRLQPAAAEQNFSLFFDLLQASLHRIARAGANGQGHAADLAAAKRLSSPARLASLAELWETLARDRGEASDLNLDRKALILRSLLRLDAVFR